MAKRLRYILLLCVCLSGLLASSASAKKLGSLVAPGTSCLNQLSPELSVFEQETTMRCMHNYARKKRHLRQFRYNATLQAAADRKAADLLLCQTFSHSPCGGGIFSVLKNLGYANSCFGVAENIAWGSGGLGSARTTMRGWINSSGHRANLLNRRYRDLGVSVVKGTFLGMPNAQVWVAEFGYRC
jgi:uncharacterized protein YkwD